MHSSCGSPLLLISKGQRPARAEGSSCLMTVLGGLELHSVRPWMLRARYAVSVAVITSAALGRRCSSRPVSYAVGDVGFLFALGKVGGDAIRISPAGILDPLWGGESRGRAENEASNHHSCVPQFHGTPHRGLLSWRFIAHLSDQLPLATQKNANADGPEPPVWSNMPLSEHIRHLRARKAHE